MSATVHPITRDTDANRLTAAADTVRGDCETADDLADLLAAVAAAVAARHDPPMSEAELWRWSGVVGAARRISRKWS